jgi:uncharacterized peroxidase-related enzyme
MAHINLNNDLPGIRGLMAFSPQTAGPLNQLAETLLRSDDNTLSRGERELIGSYVSYLNDCLFCRQVHGALAGHYLQCDIKEIENMQRRHDESALSEKMKSLLKIAASVQKGGKHVTAGQVQAARAAGATDKEIHDAVLIAAAFCMFNRYVDGLNTAAPTDQDFYVERAPRRAAEGYVDFDLNR